MGVVINTSIPNDNNANTAVEGPNFYRYRMHFIDSNYISKMITRTTAVAGENLEHYKAFLYNPFTQTNKKRFTAEMVAGGQYNNSEFLPEWYGYLINAVTDDNVGVTRDMAISSKLMQQYRCLYSYPLIYSSIKKLQDATTTVKTVKATLVNSINAALSSIDAQYSDINDGFDDVNAIDLDRSDNIILSQLKIVLNSYLTIITNLTSTINSYKTQISDFNNKYTLTEKIRPTNPEHSDPFDAYDYATTPYQTHDKEFFNNIPPKCPITGIDWWEIKRSFAYLYAQFRTIRSLQHLLTLRHLTSTNTLTTTLGSNCLIRSLTEFAYPTTTHNSWWSEKYANGNHLDRYWTYVTDDFNLEHWLPYFVTQQSNGLWLVTTLNGIAPGGWGSHRHTRFLGHNENAKSCTRTYYNDWKTAVAVFDQIPFTDTSIENVKLNDNITKLDDLAFKVNAKIAELNTIYENHVTNTNNGLNI